VRFLSSSTINAQGPLPSPCDNKQHATFVDVGTGNGSLLFALREDGEFEGKMVGIDYSAVSVELAKAIGVEKNSEEEGMGDVEFAGFDVMSQDPATQSWFPSTEGGFDVVLDKGTFDAISLSEEKDDQGKRVFERYPHKVQALVRPGGLVVVTSCNWTDGELRAWFEFEESELSACAVVQYPSFTFGGKKGQSVVTIIFRRKA
jgi:EEF1A lysine methyltransferase 2